MREKTPVHVYVGGLDPIHQIEAGISTKLRDPDQAFVMFVQLQTSDKLTKMITSMIRADVMSHHECLVIAKDIGLLSA